MLRARLALIIGFLLALAACLLPCGPFLDLSGTALPYQDPTDEMLQQQALEVAALERQLATRAWIAMALLAAAVAAFVYAWKQRRHRKAGPRT